MEDIKEVKAVMSFNDADLFGEEPQQELVGIRVVVDEKPSLIMTGSNGHFRLNAAMVALMGISYADVNTSDKEERGVLVNLVKLGGNNYALVVVQAPYDNGAKLASPTRAMSGSLQFTAKGAWISLQGKDAVDRIYTFDESNVREIPANAPDGFKPYGRDNGGKLFILSTFTEKESERREVDEETKAAASVKRNETKRINAERKAQGLPPIKVKKNQSKAKVAALNAPNPEEFNTEFDEDEKAPNASNNTTTGVIDDEDMEF